MTDVEDNTDTLSTIGAFISGQKFTLGKLIEALMFLSADALSQVTDGKYDQDLFDSAVRDYSAAYKICCGESVGVTPTTH